MLYFLSSAKNITKILEIVAFEVKKSGIKNNRVSLKSID